MGILDSLKAWFRTEAAEAKDLLGDTQSRLEADLDRREADAAASPSERLEQLQEQIAANDDGLDAIRDKIEGRGLRAEATEDLAAVDRSVREAAADEAAAAADHIVDADVVEETDGPGGTTPA